MFGTTFSAPIQSIQAAAAKVENHARSLARGEIEPAEIIGIMNGQRTVEANLVTIKAGNEMIGSLLDALA